MTLKYFPTLLEVIFSSLDGKMMKQALNELDPFVYATPSWRKVLFGTGHLLN